MHKNIGPALKSAKTLNHVREELIKLFKVTKNGKTTKVGYVAGVMYSEGLEFAQTNLKKLSSHAEKLRKTLDFPMFTAVDVFPPEVYKNLEEWELPFDRREAKVRDFWRQILKSGHITDIFMTPRWDKSKGATDEHKTAKEIGLRIHYIEAPH